MEVEIAACTVRIAIDPRVAFSPTAPQKILRSMRSKTSREITSGWARAAWATYRADGEPRVDPRKASILPPGLKCDSGLFEQGPPEWQSVEHDCTYGGRYLGFERAGIERAGVPKDVMRKLRITFKKDD